MISLDKFTHKMGLFKIHIFVMLAIACEHHTDGFVVGVRSIPQKDDNLQDTDVLEYLRDVIARDVGNGRLNLPPKAGIMERNDIQNLEEKAHNEYLRDVIARDINDGGFRRPDIDYKEGNDIQNREKKAHNEMKDVEPDRWSEDDDLAALEYYNNDWSRHHKRNPSSDVDASAIQLEKRYRQHGFLANQLEKRYRPHGFLANQLEKRYRPHGFLANQLEKRQRKHSFLEKQLQER